MEWQRPRSKTGPNSWRSTGEFKTVLLGFALALAVSACSATVGSGSNSANSANGSASTTQPIVVEVADEITATDESDPAVDTENEADLDPVPALVASMSTEEKVGQLLMPMIFGTGGPLTANERQQNLNAHGYATPAEIVGAYKLGGVIYLESNISSAPQVRDFSRQLQDAAAESSGIGLLVAIDQEGGQVSRLSDEVSRFPAASDLSGDPLLVQESSYITGQQVQQQGINVVLAPVADVVDPVTPGFIGDRSFGSDPELVATMVSAAVDGLQQSGVAAAVKHWPGHGATSVDSHSRLPFVDVDQQLWEQRERVPFAAAIDHDVAIVLVGHLAMPQLDDSALPATVSPILINGLLRSELGFDGVVMSDALNMGAVDDIDRGELAVGAVLAGIDIVLIPPSLQDASAGLNSAVSDGTISAEVLDAAVTRVLRLKHQLGLLEVTQ